jgi:hypothetical protein
MHLRKRQVGATQVVAFFLNRHFGCQKHQFKPKYRAYYWHLSWAFTGSKGSGFKVAFSAQGCIWDAYLREKRQFRQAQSKIRSQIGNYLGKWALLAKTSGQSLHCP